MKKRTTLAAFGAAALAAGLACQGSAAVATPTAAALAGAAATQAAVEQATQGVGWAPIFSEPFASNAAKLWDVGPFSDDYHFGSSQIAGGALRFEWAAHKGASASVRANTALPANIIISVDATQLRGPDESQYGLIFREQDRANFYYFGITNSGVLRLWRQVDYEWRPILTTDLPPGIVQPGQPNRLTVYALGPHVDLFVNGQLAGAADDPGLTGGGVGLITELPKDGDQGAWIFDNLEARAYNAGMAPSVTSTALP